MITFPNAKINLGLNVVSKRADGYHNLESIFYPLMIKDALEIIVLEGTDNDVFSQSGIAIDGDCENNLVMKALRLMREEYQIPPLEIHLLKKIPFGAGLGGGSADASFMLKLLNQTFSLGASDQVLANMAVRIGADCPVFIFNRPLLASGIGEVFEDIDLSLDDYYIVLVKPNIHVSTKDAFAQVVPSLPEHSLRDIVKLPIEEWKGMMKNDFEKSVFAKYPEIATIKELLYDKGAIYASMSGSGSSVYGLFKEKPNDIDSGLENIEVFLVDKDGLCL